MIFNVGAGGSSTAKAVGYDNSKSGLESTDVQGALDEVTESLTNENNESFNFGVLNGVRGFFTNPSRADDSFIPFSKFGNLPEGFILVGVNLKNTSMRYDLNGYEYNMHDVSNFKTVSVYHDSESTASVVGVYEEDGTTLIDTVGWAVTKQIDVSNRNVICIKKYSAITTVQLYKFNVVE